MAHRASPISAGIVLLEDVDFSRLRGDSGITDSTTKTTSLRTNFTSHSVTNPPRENYGLDQHPYPATMFASEESSVVDDRETSSGQGPYTSKSTIHISITHILTGILLGLVVGVILYFAEPSPLLIKWIQLPGDLFLRAIKCFMVPYVFCAVAVAIGDLVFVGKVSVVGYQTARLFVLQWLTATTAGMVVAMLLRPYMRRSIPLSHAPTNSAIMGLSCGNGQFLELQANDTLACTSSKLNATASAPTAFYFTDTKKSFQVDITSAFFYYTKADVSSLTKYTVSEQLLTTLLGIVPDNIFTSMANADLLSIITFTMVFGTIAGRQYFSRSRRVNYVYLTLLQARDTFFVMMEWVIALTPVAVVSLIGGSMAANQGVFKYDGANYMYVVGICASAMLQIFVLFPAMVFLMTRCNPYKHMAKMARAYAFAFACSSSLSTAPVTLSCVNRAKVCSRSLANFVISLGVCSNSASSGFYYPMAVIYLIESSGLGDVLTPWRLVLLFVLTVVACAGTPPIPNGGFVIVTTMFRTVTGVENMLAESFAFLWAAEILCDRLLTVCNVNDDVMALKVIAETTDETVAAEYLGERF